MKPGQFAVFGAITIILASATVSSLAAKEDGEVTLKVGDPAVNGSFIKQYKNLFQLSFRKRGTKNTVLAATWSDVVKQTRIDGHSVMKRTQIAHYLKKDITVTTVNVFDPQTMRPLSTDETRVGMTGYTHRQFDGAAIKFRRVNRGEDDSHEGEARLEVPVFDFYGGMWGLLLASCPLREGYKGALPSVAENEENLRWCRFEVTGREMVAAGGGKKVEAWVVKTDDHGAMTFWLTRESPYVIKLVYDSEQGTFTYWIA